MQISRILAGQEESSAADYPGGLGAAVTALNAPQGISPLTLQLRAYNAVSDRWRTAGRSERATLAQALSESPFAQRVQSTLNAFTRAAWAGPDAVPPEPQVRLLKAFDALPEADQQIVAAMRAERGGAITPISPIRYRARLQAEVDAAMARPRPAAAPAVTITLSTEAQAMLSGTPLEADRDTVDPSAMAPQFAAAMSAYRKAGARA